MIFMGSFVRLPFFFFLCVLESVISVGIAFARVSNFVNFGFVAFNNKHYNKPSVNQSVYC